MEPMQRVTVNVVDHYSGRVIQAFNVRKGVMEDMDSSNGYTKLVYVLPARSLIGYRHEFTNETHGEGTLVTQHIGFAPYVGELPRRSNGVMVSTETGTTMAYSLQFLEDRGVLLVPPSAEVYEGQIIGINNMSNDLSVNPIKNKNLTSVRSANTDVAVSVSAHRVMSLEEALEFIEDDETEVYTLVGTKEADVFNNKISTKSPIAMAIMGKKVGDVATVKCDAGDYDVKVVDIKIAQ
jgi:GTP-binding protein